MSGINRFSSKTYQLFKKVEPFCQRPLFDLYNHVPMEEIEELYIVDHVGRRVHNKSAMLVYKEAIITQIHADGRKVFIEVYLK